MEVINIQYWFLHLSIKRRPALNSDKGEELKTTGLTLVILIFLYVHY